tara:strand:+ start:1923 stop:3257 length:1335 start_codon:yes stop_codon:yes gene_type:complete
MPQNVNTTTIIAESTPPGRGGVSIIRMSGPDSLGFLSKITKTEENDFKPRLVYRKFLWNDNGDLIDEVLVTYFKKPKSYTGEDMAEISCHGSPLIVAKTLLLLGSLGAALANPGDYTKRAFLNGKLNMLQAEAVGEVISARTEKALQLNLKILKENDPKALKSIREKLVLTASNIEHALDISDEDLEPGFYINTINSITYATEKLDGYIANYKENLTHLRPQVVVFYGKPNAGKSTLFNAVLNKERAITSETPGTTRDTIEQETYIGGLCVRLIDTAGTRTTKNKIEAEGLRRTEEALLKADLILHVVEGVDIIKDMDKKIIVYNKKDLIKYKKPKAKNESVVYLSAKERLGIDTLKEKINSHLLSNETGTGGSIITTNRQLQAITDSAESLKSALGLLQNTNPEIELVAFELRSAIAFLSGLLGTTNPEEVMENVFKNFCVGK